MIRHSLRFLLYVVVLLAAESNEAFPKIIINTTKPADEYVTENVRISEVSHKNRDRKNFLRIGKA